jgi:hypothetical protein
MFVALGAAAWTAPGASASAARMTRSQPYTVRSAAYRAVARFRVTYGGSGGYSTGYRSQPPNPGGNPDRNRAKDSSRQSWSLRFTRTLTVPSCGCRGLRLLSGATGITSITASVDHVHIDGLYPAQDAAVSCQLRYSTPGGTRLGAALRIAYSRSGAAITALTPVADALLLMPSSCPGQGDSLDGLADNYFTPGFSFASGYGAERWFQSGAVAIPARVLHRASRLTIRVSGARGGVPPPGCAVPHPSYQQCRTGGTWAGTVTFSRVG